MRLSKKHIRRTPIFYLVDPQELKDFDEWAEWLEALLHAPCVVNEVNGELVLLEIRLQVAKLDGLKIEVYPNEHPPPHFHVKSPNVDATFTIENCKKLRGNISGGDFRKIRYWHKHSKPILLKHWNMTRPTDCVITKYR